MSVVDSEISFIETINQLWKACGEIDSWRAGLPERLFKNLLSTCNNKDFDQILFEAAVINYSRRKLYVCSNRA